MGQHTSDQDIPGATRRKIGLIAGPCLFLALLFLPPPDGMAPAAWRVAAVALLMAIWWITEAVPVAATALLPLALFPPLGAASLSSSSNPYANPLIFLFLGGFILALALERWGLHRRLALALLTRIGTRPSRVTGGFMLVTAGLSMWVSNTATALMMLPIALSVIAAVQGQESEGTPVPVFATGLLLGIAYAANIGGIGTLIGTPPNALLAGYMAETHGLAVGFARWMAFAVPLSILLLGLAWLLITQIMFRAPDRDEARIAAALASARAALGPITQAERRVAAIFILTALAWLLRPAFADWTPGLSDAGIAIISALALFILPAGGKLRKQRLMDWDWAKRLPWDVLILFGGGLSLAAAIDETGLAMWLGGRFNGIGGMPIWLALGLVATLVIFLTEITSNTATAATFIPLAAALAIGLGEPPLGLAAMVALGASCAFMMPVATPPNAIIFGSGLVTIPAMAKTGLWLNFAAILAVTLTGYALLPLIFAAQP